MYAILKSNEHSTSFCLLLIDCIRDSFVYLDKIPLIRIWDDQIFVAIEKLNNTEECSHYGNIEMRLQVHMLDEHNAGAVRSLDLGGSWELIGWYFPAEDKKEGVWTDDRTQPLC